MKHHSLFATVLKTLKAHKRNVIIGFIIFVVLIALVFVLIKKINHPHTKSNGIDISTSAKTIGNSDIAVPKPINSNNIVKWTKSVSDSTDSTIVDGSIVETIDKNQEFDGNIDLPKGWTVEYSIDNENTPAQNRVYSATAPSDLSTVKYLKINTGVADGLKPYSQAPLVQPLDATRLVSDGSLPHAPIVYNDKVFLVMRGVKATGSSYYTLDCFDLTTYQRCTDITFPTYFSASGTYANPTTLGTGARDISTPYNMQYVLDDGTYDASHKGRLYIPGQQGNNYGVTCVDLQNFKNCGFSTLGTSAAPSGAITSGASQRLLPYNPVLVSGFIQSGSKLYGHANDADKVQQTVVCFDINPSSYGTCSGFSANSTTHSSIPTYYIPEHDNSYNTPGSHVMSGDRLYWNVNYRSGNQRLLGIYTPAPQRDLGTRIACYDVVQKAPCNSNGWSTPILYTSGGVGIERPYGLYLWKQAGNVDYGICLSTGMANGADPVQSCRNLTSGAVIGTNPQIFPTSWLLIPWTMGPNITTITDGGHTKSYFPMYKTGDNNTNDIALNAAPSKGATICFDWDLQETCEGWAKPKYWHDVNSGYSGDVGYAFDGSCMLAVGYSGYLWSFNASSAETPCRVARTKYTASISQDDFYCDGNTHAFSWRKAKLSKGSMYDFQSFNVTVKNSAGQVLMTQNIKDGSQELDLSSINYALNPQLSLEVTSSVYNTSPWATVGGNKLLPYANVVTSSNDDVQYCYQTKIKDKCNISNALTNSEATITTATDTLTSNKSQSISVLQPQETQCLKDLKVSVSSNVSEVRNNENVTYAIRVDNKANTDPENLGDVPSSDNPNTAQIEATIPANMEYVSSTNGGQLQGNKVIWENQSVPAFNFIAPTVTLKATGVLGMSDTPNRNVVYAATNQEQVLLEAQVVYQDDVYQSDNFTADQGVSYVYSTPPQVAISASSYNITNPNGYSLEVNAIDPYGISRIDILEDDSLVKSCFNTTNCIFTVSGAVSAGTYSYTAIAYDNSDPAISNTSNTEIITVSDPPAVNSPPTITLSAPSTVLSTPAAFNIDVSANDSDGLITKIDIYKNGSIVKTCNNLTTCQLAQTVNDQANFVYYATAYDDGSPAATATTTYKTIIVNNAAPSSTVTLSDTNVIAPNNYSVNAVASDGGLSIDKIEILQNGSIVKTCNSVFTCDYTVTNSSAGSYIYTAKAYDTDANAPRNTTSSSKTVTVAPANVGPTSSLSLSNSTVTAQQSFSATATGSDSDGYVSKIEILLGGVIVKTCLSSTGIDPDTQEQVIISASPCTYDGNDYTAGSYQFSAKTYDNGSPNLVTTSSTRTLTVTTPAPVQDPDDFQFSLFLSATSGTAPAAYSVTANIRDTDVALNRIEIYQNTDLIKTCNSVKTCSVSASNINAGSYQYYAIGVNTNGISSTTPTQVVTISDAIVLINNQPPSISTTVTKNSAIAPANFIVYASASDSDGNVTKIEILQNGVVIRTCLSLEFCSISLTNYTAGNYSYTSKAYDNGSPNLVTTSDPQIVAISEPEPTPTPTPNSLPVVKMQISDTVLTSPGSLQINVTSSDSDGSIKKTEIYNAGVLIHSCGESESCTYKAKDLASGTYTYSAKVWDNVDGTSTTSTQAIEVLSASSAVTSSGGGSTTSNSSGGGSLLSRIAAVPQNVSETLGVAIDASARTVKPVSPAVARAIPYTTISLIFVFSLFYFYQAYNQAQSQILLSKLAKRFKQTKANRKNYIDLTSHYISTPITTMSSTLELQESSHSIPEKVLRGAQQAIMKLRDDSKRLLSSSQELSDDSTAIVKSLDNYRAINIIKNPALIIPLVAVFVIVLFANAVFIRAEKYSASIVTVLLQTSLYALAVVTLVAGFIARRKQKFAYALANEEYQLEQEINNAQSKFIADTSAILSKDVDGIKEYAATLSKAPQGDKFNSGYKSLNKAVSKLAYLNQLTQGSIKIHSDPVNLHNLAEEVFITYRPIALQSQLNLVADVDPNIHAIVDPQGFKYILISVLDNAIKFTKPGGDIKVTIKDVNKKFAMLTIQDTGAGIPKNKVDSLFAPFSRGTDTLKFDYEGLGLDLYMDKLIAEQAGGEISLSSIEGAYTTVSVKLPKK